MKNFFGAILKILVFLLGLPLLAAFLIAFQDRILSLPAAQKIPILWGAGIYVGLNLFVYDFENVYAFGKQGVEKICAFFKPAGYILPVYSILLVILYVVLLMVGHGASWQAYFLFAIAFTLAMHVVQTAHEIYTADSSLLKAHYLCTFGVVLIVNLFLISLLLALVIGEYSLMGFFKSLSTQTCHFYKSVYKVLFIDSSV